MANIHTLAFLLDITPSSYFYIIQIMHQVRSSPVSKFGTGPLTNQSGPVRPVYLSRRSWYGIQAAKTSEEVADNLSAEIYVCIGVKVMLTTIKTATEVGVRAIQDHKVIEWNTCWKCRLSEGTDDK
jgi:hypothetical protein